MKTLVVIVIMFSALAFGEEATQPLSFVDTIKSGFDRDLAKEPNAKWLGSGNVEVVANSYVPDVASRQKEWNFESDGYPDGSQWTSKIPAEEIRSGRAKGEVLSCTRATWVAWIGADGLINLILDQPLKKAEYEAINALLTNELQKSKAWKSWSEKVDYVATVTYAITPTAKGIWISATEARFSWLTLGLGRPGQEKKDLETAFQNLYNIDVLHPARE